MQFIKNTYNWIKTNIKKTLIGLGIIGVAVASTALPVDEKIQLQKVNIIGDAYYHQFIDSEGNITDMETTFEDFEAFRMNTGNYVIPTKLKVQGSKWNRSAYKTFKVDTVSGKLENGQYVELVEGKSIILLSDNEWDSFHVESDAIVGDKISIDLIP